MFNITPFRCTAATVCQRFNSCASQTYISPPPRRPSSLPTTPCPPRSTPLSTLTMLHEPLFVLKILSLHEATYEFHPLTCPAPPSLPPFSLPRPPLPSPSLMLHVPSLAPQHVFNYAPKPCHSTTQPPPPTPPLPPEPPPPSPSLMLHVPSLAPPPVAH